MNQALAAVPTAQPCLIIRGELSNIKEAVLVVEKKAVTTFPPTQALVILLGAYPEDCKNMYTFFEVVFLMQKACKKDQACSHPG